MKNEKLILTVHGKNIATLKPDIQYPGVILHTTTRSENPNYLFITLLIGSEAKAGTMKINFLANGKITVSYPYELLHRKTGSADREGFGSEDVIYLVMSDRFANGDTTNDIVLGLTEATNRGNPDGRHGGDISGMINHLDYLQQLGITALWTTPLLEDNQDTYSYHTYAVTNYFKIDGRYGSNDDFVRLADECHRRGIKLIMDLVPNHCGSKHFWVEDLPMSDWFHQYPEFTRTNYAISTWNDPHAAMADKNLNANGWFDVTMPDLNQDNPVVLSYFKQFAIFWIEFAALDGLRVDTYPYNDKWKIAEWTKAIRDEYPNINIMGECWQHNPAEIAYWQTGSTTFDGYDSYLPTVMDFPLLDAFGSAFNEDVQSWDRGVSRFYNNYVLDYLYANPDNLLVFLDNHDTQRFAESIGFDMQKYKLAVAHLLTTRGIPQIYYGTEIMMGGDKNKGDGDIRRDFPGGWPKDVRNAFHTDGRSPIEKEAFDFMQALLIYRKSNDVLQTGKMIQFIPRDNVFVYFRLNAEKTVMVVLNNSANRITLDTKRFEECISGVKMAKDVITGQAVNLADCQVDAKMAMVLELQK
jgi:glycosidase